jgi:uncharacterized Zn ribbon protein
MAKAATKSNGKKRGAPMKKCPKCDTEVHARKMECPECHHKFSFKKVKQASPKTKRRATTANGSADIKTIVTVQRLLQSVRASELKRIVDEVAEANVPF